MLLASIVCCCITLHADVIRLKNGDRISGTVTGLDSDGLLVKSSYAGELKIKVTAVKELSADQPLHLRTKTNSIETRNVELCDGELHAETVFQ